jgi:hypothetical protein
MQIAEMMKPDGRVFLKSEWGPIDDGWPCVSFTKKSVGDKLRRNFVSGRDVLVYVGTTNPEHTERPEHRSRLISVVSIEPKHVLETRNIVPPERWVAAVERYGGDRWPYSMAVLQAADIIGPPYPHAHDVTRFAYRSLSEMANRGSVVEVLGSERAAVKALPIHPLHLNLRKDVVAYLHLRGSLSLEIEKSVKQEAFRMASLIRGRVESSGELSLRINPARAAPNLSDLIALILRKWHEDQTGVCALCGGKLIAGTTNPMLQPSADRIDSGNHAYDGDNLQITHLSCNLAKNKYGVSIFEDWMTVIRGVDLASDS